MDAPIVKQQFINKYQCFLRSKMRVADETGFDVSPEHLHPSLKEHQKESVVWALSLGRALIAMSFGLGKSRIQIEIARQIIAREGGKFLIICPLGAKHQFIHKDGPVMDTRWAYVRNDAGWEHVSVCPARLKRTPTWDEMRFIKGLFWEPEEVVIQYHPPESEYVNVHDYCLHLRKPIGIELPVPPSILVGPKRKRH